MPAYLSYSIPYERKNIMPILNKKERQLIEEKKERGEELTSEEICDLGETLDFEEGYGRPRIMEVVDEEGTVTWEPIDN
jgi:hypothetical protein